jgi:hypothetical protein
MRVGQRQWTAERGWSPVRGEWSRDAQLILVFGAREAIESGVVLAELKEASPRAHLLACTTSGEILGVAVSDGTAVATAVELEHSWVNPATVDLDGYSSSREAGAALARALAPKSGLVHVFVLSDGLKVNGSDLVRGLSEGLPRGVSITGGLSGDAARFERTLVALDSLPTEGRIAAIGFGGERIRFGCGSMGGWDPFGPERLVSRSRGNVVYELDGRPALDLYTSYLGEYAKDLPSSGLLFPLCLRLDDGTDGVVRTILSVDREARTMKFAGDIPEGAYARLMKANFDRLIDGATEAATRSTQALAGSQAGLAILISCVGRKLVLKQRVEEEVEGVREVLGPRPAFAGFYSYGELSPFTPSAKCELHNQTMTITTIGEV